MKSFSLCALAFGAALICSAADKPAPLSPEHAQHFRAIRAELATLQRQAADIQARARGELAVLQEQAQALDKERQSVAEAACKAAEIPTAECVIDVSTGSVSREKK